MVTVMLEGFWRWVLKGELLSKYYLYMNAMPRVFSRSISKKIMMERGYTVKIHHYQDTNTITPRCTLIGCPLKSTCPPRKVMHYNVVYVRSSHGCFHLYDINLFILVIFVCHLCLINFALFCLDASAGVRPGYAAWSRSDHLVLLAASPAFRIHRASLIVGCGRSRLVGGNVRRRHRRMKVGFR